MQKTPQFYWLALTYLPRLGGVTLKRLLKQFGNLTTFFNTPPDQLATVPYLSPEIVEALSQLSLPDIAQESNQLKQNGITLLTWEDETYPKALFELQSTPPVLFMRGEMLAQNAQAVAIVGSRRVSEFGLMRAHILAEQLATAGFTIISGLALGIDTAAHQGALATLQGRTIAVLGSGVQRVYPVQNRQLAQTILKRGALLSEQHPLTKPEPQYLMMRNRLIAALSQAVIVVEATIKSGALETARQAQRQGLQRSVFAYPGSPGTDALLRSGAIPIPHITTLIERLKQPQKRLIQGRLF